MLRKHPPTVDDIRAPASAAVAEERPTPAQKAPPVVTGRSAPVTVEDPSGAGRVIAFVIGGLIVAAAIAGAVVAFS